MRASTAAKQPSIVLLINRLQGGGAERVVAALANAWVEQGKDVHVVLTLPRQPQQPAEYEVSRSVKRHYWAR